MGKGDKKSKKGKIWRGSYGVSRKRKKDLQADATSAAKASKADKADTKAEKPKKRTARKKKAE